MIERPPYPSGDLYQWALDIVAYIERSSGNDELSAAPVFLQHRVGDEKAVTDGIMMFDPALGEPVYSHNGVWKKMDGTLA